MKNLVIRKFRPADVDDFIRLSKTSFAEETLAAGITPEDFDRETRRIFRWKMIPYKLLTVLMGVKWEAFVAEIDSKVVGGGMYIGSNNRMAITNLMVDPEYRRQGIGQALLVKRLERLSERGFPFVTAQVLETNKASLANLRKQNFQVFNQYSTYIRKLPLLDRTGTTLSPLVIRDIKRSDRVLFLEMESKNTPQIVLDAKGSEASQYFQSGWIKLYARFTYNLMWIKAFEVRGKTIGFINLRTHSRQKIGYILTPVVLDEHLHYLPAIIQSVEGWLVELGKESIVIEVPHQRTQIIDYLISTGWEKQHTWHELIKWLDIGASPKY